MCGIVGILGKSAVSSDLVDALRRLEYRGYDSAGVATVEEGSLARRRAEGTLRNLERRLLDEPLAGRTASVIRAGRRTAVRRNATRIRT
jgi:glucosamine--fructose-6-phosphate aminotransferase (isomerizing)